MTPSPPTPTTGTEYEFDVGVSTHDQLRKGITVDHYTRVQVFAENHQLAGLIALEIAAAGGWMPTLLLDRI